MILESLFGEEFVLAWAGLRATAFFAVTFFADTFGAAFFATRLAEVFFATGALAVAVFASVCALAAADFAVVFVMFNLFSDSFVRACSIDMPNARTRVNKNVALHHNYF